MNIPSWGSSAEITNVETTRGKIILDEVYSIYKAKKLIPENFPHYTIDSFLTAKNIKFIDAPVGRLVSHAISGDSLFMVGCDEEDAFKSVALNDNEFSGKVSLTYIDLPIMYNYQSENGFYAEVGLQPGFLIGAKDKFDGGSYDYKESIKRFI